MKLINILILAPILFFIGCSSSSDTVVIIDDTPIQYTIEVLSLSAETTDPDYFVKISNIYSSDTVSATGDIAVITDENDNAPMTFDFLDTSGNLLYTQTIVVSDFEDPILLTDGTPGDDNSISFTYGIVLQLKKDEK